MSNQCPDLAIICKAAELFSHCSIDLELESRLAKNNETRPQQNTHRFSRHQSMRNTHHISLSNHPVIPQGL